MVLFCGLEDGFLVHHHTQVHHIEAIASQDDAGDVLANIVDIPLDRRMDDDRALRCLLAGFHIGFQQSHSVLHHLGRLHDLGEEHLPFAETSAYFLHSGHQRSLNDLYGRSELFQGGVDGFLQVVFPAGEQHSLKGFLRIGEMPGRGRA